MSDAGLDDQTRSNSPHEFLNCNHVLWVLDDRSAKPVKVVEILLLH